MQNSQKKNDLIDLIGFISHGIFTQKKHFNLTYFSTFFIWYGTSIFNKLSILFQKSLHFFVIENILTRADRNENEMHVARWPWHMYLTCIQFGCKKTNDERTRTFAQTGQT